MRMTDRDRVDDLQGRKFVVIDPRDVDLTIEVCMDDARIIPNDAAIGSPIH